MQVAANRNIARWVIMFSHSSGLHSNCYVSDGNYRYVVLLVYSANAGYSACVILNSKE